jgi:CYTH domain-containing protein
MLEIERKFLVVSDAFKKEAFKKEEIHQGYLSKDPERSVRVRIKGEKAFLTIKGKPNDSGTTRFEWEKEIPKEEAEALLKLCLPEIIQKTRYFVEIGNHIFEVDEFFGENHGLLLAEIELSSEGDDFSKPEWLGKEVTGQVEFYNAYLSEHPFSQWKQ